MVLSDRTIREEIAAGRLVIDPWDDTLLQPSSVDLRVAGEFRVFHNNRRTYIDVKDANDDLTEVVAIPPDEAFILHPGEFVLGSTHERVALPDDLVGRLEGKSSLGRLGLLIHSTAGFIDPGWDGHITLELYNAANLPITLYPGMKIGQVRFLAMTTAAVVPYGSGNLGSKYQGQARPHTEPLLGVLQRGVITRRCGPAHRAGGGRAPRGAVAARRRSERGAHRGGTGAPRTHRPPTRS